VDVCSKIKGQTICMMLKQSLVIKDIATVVHRNRLRWHGHVLRKDDGDCVKTAQLLRLRGQTKRKT